MLHKFFHTSIALKWFPGHSNDIADSLARQGSQKPFIGPEPMFGLLKRISSNTIHITLSVEPIALI